MKYNLMQIFYWLAICSLHGFAAIFLSSKGLTNTEIGAATGGACILAIPLAPLLSSISIKFNKISLQKFIAGAMIFAAAAYLMMAFIPLPSYLMIALYIMGCCIGMSQVAFLSQLSMDYIERGNKLNFGLARGLGSFAYAVGAIIFSEAATRYTPSVLAILCTFFSVLFCISLFQVKPVYACESGKKEKGGSLLGCIGRYPGYFIILIGVACIFAGAAPLSTYLINIIKSNGGSESIYGIAVFCMSTLELPVMALTDKLIERFGTTKLIAAAVVLFALRNLLVAASPNLSVLIVGIALRGIAYGLLIAVLTVHVSRHLRMSDQVMGQTLIVIMTSGIGSTIGNMSGGWMLDNMGMPAVMTGTILISLIAVCIVSAVCMKPKKEKRLTAAYR